MFTAIKAPLKGPFLYFMGCLLGSIIHLMIFGIEKSLMITPKAFDFKIELKTSGL